MSSGKPRLDLLVHLRPMARINTAADLHKKVQYEIENVEAMLVSNQNAFKRCRLGGGLDMLRYVLVGLENIVAKERDDGE
jgi:hypothetical protein